MNLHTLNICYVEHKQRRIEDFLNKKLYLLLPTL